METKQRPIARRELMKFFGVTSAGVYGASVCDLFSLPKAIVDSSLFTRKAQPGTLIHPAAALYTTPDCVFVSTFEVSQDGKTVKKIYRVNGTTTNGQKPHPRFNNRTAMTRLFNNDIKISKYLSKKYPQFFPAPSKINHVERSFEMPYLGEDLIAIDSNGSLSYEDAQMIVQIRDILRQEKIAVKIKPGNLHKANGSIYLSGFNFAKMNSTEVTLKHTLEAAVNAANAAYTVDLSVPHYI